VEGGGGTGARARGAGAVAPGDRRVVARRGLPQGKQHCRGDRFRERDIEPMTRCSISESPWA